MRLHRALALAVAALAWGPAACSCTRAAPAGPAAQLLRHTVQLDGDAKLLPWTPYGNVARLAWTALETRFPPQDNGLPTFMAYSRFDPDEFWGVSWPHNPAGLYAMLTDSAVLWYQYSGDGAAVALVRRALDHQLAHGTTPASWDWASVPYASANPGDVEYGGADDAWCDFCGRGDGAGVIEPDKVGELGFAYLQMFELSGESRYRDAALACADALARHVREGDAAHSPWPFRVYAESNIVREDYSSNVIGAITLFDELSRLHLEGVGADAYARARSWALQWLLRVPMRNDAWSGYFEDIEIQTDPSSNPNQYAAMRAARWLLQHAGQAGGDPDWRAHAAHLLSWVAQTFGGDTDRERGTQFGATVLSEQRADMAKMGSHTARYGATMALWGETTGNPAARDRAARSLAWASYTCDERGIVAVGPDTNEGWWFSDGYGDYIRHFLFALGAVPDWAPGDEVHLLRSTSIVTHVDYSPGRVAWRTFDADSTETLRLPSRPRSVTASGAPVMERSDLQDVGYVVRRAPTGGVVLAVRHRSSGETSIALP